ncbi:MAG: hypothetical protein ACAF41_06635 [Leptolyngbya sp. BL-A-14]
MSLNKSVRHVKEPLSRLALIACMVYLFIRFFPVFRPLATGLDPSWVYTINYAASHDLTFGKDIIFTYGPLGYLLTGLAGTGSKSSFFQAFSFQLLLHIALLILTFIKVQRLNNILQKTTLLISLFVFYFLATGLGVAPEYQILLLLFTFLSNDPFSFIKVVRQQAVLLGIFTGFALFTKFTVSICAFAAALIFLSVSLYQAIRTRANRELYTLAITDFFIAIGTVSLILINPNRAQGLAYIALCLILAGLGLGLKKLAFKFRNRSLYQTTSNRKENLKQKVTDKHLFYVLYFVSLLFATLFSSSSLLAYIKSSLELSSGYSSAMSIVGNTQHLAVAISVVVLILVLLASGAIHNDLSFSLALVFFLLIAFKHGFVRQDAHELIFLSLSPWIVAMQISRIHSKRAVKLSFILFLYTSIFSLWASTLFLPYFSSTNQFLDTLSLQPAISNVINATKLDQYRANLEQASHENFRQRELPAAVKDIIGSQSVDIIPWETVIAASNDINWQPRPVFQSYLAYTAYLDSANFQSISKVPRDYLLYSFMPIDERHPFFDEPSYSRYVFCHYRVSNQSPDFFTLGTKPFSMNVALLEKQRESLCGTEASEQSFALKWRETKTLPETALITYASIDVRYSLLGKLYKALFRSPAVRIRAIYADGLVRVYRIVPDNTKNGLLLTYLPKDEEEAISLLKGNSITPVRAFQLINNSPIIFQPQIQLKLVSFPIQLLKQQALLDISRLQQAKFISQLDSKLIGHIDTADLKVSGNYKGTLTISGWASAQDSTASCWVVLTTGPEHQILGVVKTSSARPDVVKALKNETYQYTGWSGIFDAVNLPHGQSRLQAWIYDESRETATLIDQRQVILP